VPSNLKNSLRGRPIKGRSVPFRLPLVFHREVFLRLPLYTDFVFVKIENIKRMGVGDENVSIHVEMVV